MLKASAHSLYYPSRQHQQTITSIPSLKIATSSLASVTNEQMCNIGNERKLHCCDEIGAQNKLNASHCSKEDIKHSTQQTQCQISTDSDTSNSSASNCSARSSFVRDAPVNVFDVSSTKEPCYFQSDRQFNEFKNDYHTAKLHYGYDDISYLNHIPQQNSIYNVRLRESPRFRQGNDHGLKRNSLIIDQKNDRKLDRIGANHNGFLDKRMIDPQNTYSPFSTSLILTSRGHYHPTSIKSNTVQKQNQNSPTTYASLVSLNKFVQPDFNLSHSVNALSLLEINNKMASDLSKKHNSIKSVNPLNTVKNEELTSNLFKCKCDVGNQHSGAYNDKMRNSRHIFTLGSSQTIILNNSITNTEESESLFGLNKEITLGEHNSKKTIHCCLHDIVSMHKIKSNYQKFYKLGKYIRSGGFSDIYEGTCLINNCNVILKFIPKQKTKNWLFIQGKNYPSEVLLHKVVSDLPGVLNFYDYFEEKDCWVIVIERLSNCCDLFDYMEKMRYGRLTETSARSFFRQLTLANIDLIQRGVVHRDIKSENILLDIDKNKLVLIDFGASAIYQNEVYTDFHGTRQFSTPEYIRSSKYKAIPSTVWTLGVLLYDMVVGRLPFENDKDILGKQIDVTCSVSCQLRMLIHRCLQKNPDMRPTLEDLINDPWVNNSFNSYLNQSHITTNEGDLDRTQRKKEEAITITDHSNLSNPVTADISFA